MDWIEIGKVAGLCLFAYLFGSIPFGYIVGKAKKVDIRKFGSGKTGGTNIRRALGWRYAFLVSGLDVWKGAIPIIVASYFLKGSWWIVGLALIACVLGAILSIWMKLMTGKFRAGAGIATLLGGLLILAGWQIWLGIMGGWLIVFLFFPFVKRRMSVANLILVIGILMVPVLLYILPMLIIVVALIWWAHKENIQRIKSDQEPSAKLPSFFDKIPDDLISWSVEKLQLVIEKLQSLKPEDLISLSIGKLQLLIKKLQDFQKKEP